MMSTDRRYRLRRMLQFSRHRLRHRHGELMLPLYELHYVACKDIRRISTNGRYVFFDPDWLQKLSPTALDYMLAHQLMHIQLEHINRPPYYRGDRFHLACDIVANGLLRELGWQYSRLPLVGRIYCDTFFPIRSGYEQSAYEAFNGVPFDPARLSKAERNSYLIDSDQAWEDKNSYGQRGTLILSPNDPEPPDLPDDGSELGKAHLYVIKEYIKRRRPLRLLAPQDGKPVKDSFEPQIKNNAANVRNRIQHDLFRQADSDFTERQWLYRPVHGLDWRSLTQIFVSEDLHDYTFTPPDRRLSESDLFMPSYSACRESIRRLLILIDTSGSIDTETLDRVYSHLYQLLRTPESIIEGAIGFFDTRIYGPYPLDNETSLHTLRPLGGGGTDLNAVFRQLSAFELSGLIVFTDGELEFPAAPPRPDLPVLWLFTKPQVAPWGFSAVIK